MFKKLEKKLSEIKFILDERKNEKIIQLKWTKLIQQFQGNWQTIPIVSVELKLWRKTWKSCYKKVKTNSNGMKRNSWPNPCNWVKSICSNFETHNRFRIETFASVTQTLKCRRRSMSAVDRETAAVHFTASVVIHSPERLQFLSIWRWWTRENEIWKQENSRHSEWEFIFFSFAGMAQFPSSFVFFWVQLYLNGDLIVILKKETQSLVKIVFLHSKLTMNFKKRYAVCLFKF